MQAPVENDLLDFAKVIAAEAASLTLKWFQSHDLKVDIKSDTTEVTDADKAVEEYLRTAIGKEFPHDTIIGEESENFSGESHRKWIIDPIDGTASFARGVPLYSSLLAMFDDSGPAIGIIHLPALHEFIAAGRGRGVSCSQLDNSVSSISKIADSCISSSSFDIPWWSENSLLKIAASGAKTRTWGDGYGYFLVATGRIEAMIDPSLYTYDIAPMLTIIPECGGVISTWDGNTELEDKVGWVASNGFIHDDLLALLNT
jgi:histidinol phosphatase-like enzyme (inositol monophosphatase family)